MSQGSFRFTLDGFVVLENDPIGWDSAKIVVERIDEYSGLFLNYLSELEFYGDGYTYINSQLKAQGYCFSVQILVEYKCTSSAAWETVFTGFINIPNTEIDNERCVVKANLEANDIYSVFLNQSDNDFDVLNDQASLSDGTPLVPNVVTKYYHQVKTGSAAIGVSRDNSFQCIDVLDALDFYAKYYTDGRLSVVSDFFSNQQPQTELWTLALTGSTWVAGQTLTVTYRNYMGKTVAVAYAFLGSESSSLDNLGIDLCQIVDSGVSQLALAQWSTNFDASAFAHSTRSSRTLTLESWLPIEILSAVFSGSGSYPTVAFSKFRPYEKGGKNLFLTNQNNERENGIYSTATKFSNKISFKKLFQELDKVYCLGMQLSTVGGVNVLRIEPLDYFYSPISLISLPNLYDVKTNYDLQQNYSSILLGSGNSCAVQGTQKVHDFGVDGTVATNTITSVLGAFIFDEVYDHDYLILNNGSQSEVVHVLSGSGTNTLTLYEPLQFSHSDSSFVKMLYTTIQPRPSGTGVKIATIPNACLGEQLNLENEYIIDIERHFDQTNPTANNRSWNYSAALTDKFCLVQCENNDNTKVYTFWISPGALGTAEERNGFNGHMTNHHKIINSMTRFKNPVYLIATKGTQFDGQRFEYPNNNTVTPFQVSIFENFLSFSQMQVILDNPETKIDIQVNNQWRGTWIKKIEMDINTKKCSFELYEN